MLDRPKSIYMLSTWSIEKRGKRWYIIKPSFFADPKIEKGPYGTIMSACLMIARELAAEAVSRHNKQ